MVPLAIWLLSLGYTSFYYGERLWTGQPVTFAYAIGLAKTNTAATPKTGAGASSSNSVIGSGETGVKRVVGIVKDPAGSGAGGVGERIGGWLHDLF